MPTDLVAWYESQAATTLTAVAAVSGGEDAYTVSGDGIWVKEHAQYIVGLGQAFATDLGGHGEIRQNSIKVPYSFGAGGSVLGTVDRDTWVDDLRGRPLRLVPNEYVYAYTRHGTNEGAHVFAWLGDWGPVYSGPIEYRVKADSATTLTANQWTNVSLTLDNTLPEGRYAVVGFWAQSHEPDQASSPVLTRLKFKDSIYRPGVIADRGGEDSGKFASVANSHWYNYWPLTAAYSFRHDDLPIAQFLSSTTDDEETVFFDLVRLSGTPNIGR